MSARTKKLCEPSQFDTVCLSISSARLPLRRLRERLAL
jgi:hypothetical protein